MYVSTQRPDGGKTKLIRYLTSLAALVALLAVFGAHFMYVRGQEFDGTVVDKEQKLRWRYWADATARESVRYRHYLIIEEDDGSERRARVTFQTYSRAEIGDPVLKESGNLRAQLMTDEAIRAREASREGMQMIFDAVTD